MILIITNKEDLTVDYVVLELTRREVPYLRFNTEDFPNAVSITFTNIGQVSTLKIGTKSKTINVQDIEAVWYRRPGTPSIDSSIQDKGYRAYATEESAAMLQSLYRLIRCKWLNHPFDIAIAESKPYQLVLAREIGFNVPKTLITTSPDKFFRFYELCNKQVVVKPLKQATLRSNNGELVIFTSQVNKYDMQAIESIRYSPAIYQEYIDKKLDVRVTVVGDNIFPVGIKSQLYDETRVDWRRGERLDLPQDKCELPKDIQEKCFEIVRRLNLEFGAIDLALSKNGIYYFLEINPNGQWAWMEERLGLNISGAIVSVLTEDKHESIV